MSRSKIEWTDRVWNPVTGCNKVSEGCKNCYAERFAGRQMGPWRDRKFTDVMCHEDRLEIPLGWRTPQRVFVNSMSDLFHEKVPLSFIAHVFNTMASATLECKHKRFSDHEEECWTGKPHTFQILTKRPERMKEIMEMLPDYVAENFSGADTLPLMLEAGVWPLPNVWLGVSAENQQAADERVPLLLQTPAAVRFVSCEPLLGPILLTHLSYESGVTGIDALAGTHGLYRPHGGTCAKLDWVIAGGESGPKARPMHPAWASSLRDQCFKHDIPFFFKQWGEYVPGWEYRSPIGGPVLEEQESVLVRELYALARMYKVGKTYAGATIDGAEYKSFPTSHE